MCPDFHRGACGDTDNRGNVGPYSLTVQRGGKVKEM